VELFRVDPTSDAQFDAWFSVLHHADLERNQGPHGGWKPDEWRARALDVDAPKFHQLFAYGESVTGPFAIGALEYSRADNLDWIGGDLFVEPRERRKGYGSALLARLEELARLDHRRSLLFWVTEPEHEHRRGTSRFFAPHHGYEVVEENIQRDLAWPLAPGELDRLERQWAPHAGEYEILAWLGGSPEEFLDGRAHLMAVMPVEVPDAGFGAEVERWDADRVRQHDRRVNDMGRDHFVAVARRRASAELVGFSELTVSRVSPHASYQWDTLVVRAHRGHRLGGLMKLATMRLMAKGDYETTKIVTFNNERNTAMIAVNEALGARATGGIVTWRKDLSSRT
jgi:GNAT superfamily N-acetyltransferase